MDANAAMRSFISTTARWSVRSLQYAAEGFVLLRRAYCVYQDPARADEPNARDGRFAEPQISDSAKRDPSD